MKLVIFRLQFAIFSSQEMILSDYFHYLGIEILNIYEKVEIFMNLLFKLQ